MKYNGLIKYYKVCPENILWNLKNMLQRQLMEYLCSMCSVIYKNFNHMHI